MLFVKKFGFKFYIFVKMNYSATMLERSAVSNEVSRSPWFSSGWPPAVLRLICDNIPTSLLVLMQTASGMDLEPWIGNWYTYLESAPPAIRMLAFNPSRPAMLLQYIGLMQTLTPSGQAVESSNLAESLLNTCQLPVRTD